MPFSGFQDFNPDFSNALQQMIAARPGISINSGYRTPQRQAELFAQALQKYGSVQEARIHVAPAPGTYNSQGSRHNFGLAADLAYATDADRQWAHDNAEKFGLNFRMGHEPWHIELIGGKPQAVGNNSGAPVSGSSTGPDMSYMPPRPEEEPRYKDGTPFIPIGYKTDYNIGQVADPNALVSTLSPRRAKSQEILQKIRNFSQA